MWMDMIYIMFNLVFLGRTHARTYYSLHRNAAKMHETASLIGIHVGMGIVDMMTSSNERKNPRYWSFVRGIHQLLKNSPHKGQWRRTLIFPLICVWTNTQANNGDADDLKRHRVHYDVIGMLSSKAMNLHVYILDNTRRPCEIHDYEMDI